MSSAVRWRLRGGPVRAAGPPRPAS